MRKCNVFKSAFRLVACLIFAVSAAMMSSCSKENSIVDILKEESRVDPEFIDGYYVFKLYVLGPQGERYCTPFQKYDNMVITIKDRITKEMDLFPVQDRDRNINLLSGDSYRKSCDIYLWNNKSLKVFLVDDKYEQELLLHFEEVK